MSKPPHDRETIIAVIDWVVSHPDIRLSWHGYEPASKEEWMNLVGFEIDGEDALAIIANPEAFNDVVAMREDHA